MKIATPLAVLAATLLTAGCVTPSDIQKLNSQISDLQDQVGQLKRTASSKEEVQNVNRTIAEQTQTLLKSNATMSVKVDQIEERMQNTQGTIEQTNYRIDKLAAQTTQSQHDLEEFRGQLNAVRSAAATAAATQQPLADTGATTAAGGTAAMSEVRVTPPATGENPVDVYQAAYRDYQKGNYDLAIAGFQDFISQSPSSDLADNASYWVGEALFSQKKYREAIAQFDSVVTKYPRSDKVPGALLKKGYAYISLGEKSQGIVQLQYVLHEHPAASEAGLARQKLKQLGVDIK